MFASPRNDKVKCLANFALSYGKRYNLVQRYKKIVELRVRFFPFLYITPQI